eukprot:CAMPEP_0197658998 /NCGR_PEP_ID=MMETSP1338-20131121/45762_1 /TAXON_ID=43686 ORGANISM="Pelagodinium beii, Strain RCC1491" /NCGR_SAMPLE_ID=MMETSP1338 /ASSEMBLY_ACC=CAM_ASM_000754 /LENGTH=40 /DNA_ID= /DNA_START= /DNA_END= /DNA_ORIENTATION=
MSTEPSLEQETESLMSMFKLANSEYFLGGGDSGITPLRGK